VAIFPDPAPARQKAADRKTTAARQSARKKATEREKTTVSNPAPGEGDSQKRLIARQAGRSGSQG
jgi:hypothetical protein